MQLNMMGVQFDVIGQSYFPKWHGSLYDFKNNITIMAKRLPQDIILVECCQIKKEVIILHSIYPETKEKEFVSARLKVLWGKIFEKDGKSNELINLFDEFSKHLSPKKIIHSAYKLILWRIIC